MKYNTYTDSIDLSFACEHFRAPSTVLLPHNQPGFGPHWSHPLALELVQQVAVDTSHSVWLESVHCSTRLSFRIVVLERLQSCGNDEHAATL